MPFDLMFASYLVKGTVFIAAVALLLGVRPKAHFIWLVALGAGVLFLGLLCRVVPSFGIDYRLCWEAGCDLRAGEAPTVLHPPSALPLFAVFSLLPFRVSFLAWTILNAIACLCLVVAAQRTLLAQEQMDRQSEAEPPVSLSLPPLLLIGLTAAVVLSEPSLATLYLGQLCILEVVALLAALYFQSRRRPLWAGAALALATIKPGTMLPFVLLFHRKSDRWTWVSLGTIVLALCLITGLAIDLPSHLAATRDRIRELESPGRLNDFSFEGPFSYNMLGFDHAFYRLGLRDRTMIKIAQYLALLLLGGWIAYQILGKDALPRGAACSLVALYSILFLYHRIYDAVILVIPLVYAASRAHSLRTGQARRLYAACSVAILLVLYHDSIFLGNAQSLSRDWGVWGRLVQATLLPYATWLILLAMICLVVGTRRSASSSGEG